MKTAYLAGPMRGLKLFNFPAFFAAAIELRRMGYNVINPAEYDMALGMNPSLPVDHPDQISMNMEAILRQDFRQVLKSDAIVLLRGWEKSTGARIERAVAHYSGRKIYLYMAETHLKPAHIIPASRLKPMINYPELP